MKLRHVTVKLLLLFFLLDFLLDLVVAGIVGALVVIISLWTGWSLSVVIVPGLGIIKMFYNF